MKTGLHAPRSGKKCRKVKAKPHGEKGVAIVFPDGEIRWYLNEKLHRENGPAIEYPDGDKHWYRNGDRIFPCDQDNATILRKCGSCANSLYLTLFKDCTNLSYKGRSV